MNLSDLRLVKWPAAIRAARLKAREVSTRMVWIDTLPALARIAGEGENQAGTSLAVMEPLAELTADGLAVGLTFHERKSGGELGESGRGSSAFAGAVDTIVQMKGTKGLRDTCRELHAIGRFQRRAPAADRRTCLPSANSQPRKSGVVGIIRASTFVRVDPADIYRR